MFRRPFSGPQAPAFHVPTNGHDRLLWPLRNAPRINLRRSAEAGRDETGQVAACYSRAAPIQVATLENGHWLTTNVQLDITRSDPAESKFE